MGRADRFLFLAAAASIGIATFAGPATSFQFDEHGTGGQRHSQHLIGHRSLSALYLRGGGPFDNDENIPGDGVIPRARDPWRRRRAHDSVSIRRGGANNGETLANDTGPLEAAEASANETENVSDGAQTTKDGASMAMLTSSHCDYAAEQNSNVETTQKGGQGVFSTLFRPRKTSSHHRRGNNRSAEAIANSIPHGADGRGGGGGVATAEFKEEASTDFVVASVATKNDDEGDESSTIDCSSSRPETGATTAAFAVIRPQLKGATATTGTMVENAPSLNESDLHQNHSLAQNSTAILNATENFTKSNISVILDLRAKDERDDKYVSSGYWEGIDFVASLGISTLSDDFKVSRKLRTVRKAAARATGWHGLLSGKQHFAFVPPISVDENNASTVISIDEELGIHETHVFEAEILAKRVATRQRNARSRNGRKRGRRGQPNSDEYIIVKALDSSPDALEHRRRKRVVEIDRILQRGSERLLELQCERDDLLQSPNPLFNYTKKFDPLANQTFGDVRNNREFNFPSRELVDDYVGDLISSGRLVCMNHTELWQSRSYSGDEDDELIGEDLLTPSANAEKLYEGLDELERHIKTGERQRGALPNGGGGGSWLLRRGFGGASWGEKLGETIESAAYKGVASAVMMIFARMLSALHGVNIMSHSDIRLYIEQQDLPPVAAHVNDQLKADNYAQEAIKSAIKKGARKKRRSSRHNSNRRHGHELNEDAFIQRDAVVETLISHCQISAPLLKLFPLDWQRAMVGNIITLATAIVSDFADGLQVQILGHSLSFSFKPITEADLIQHIGLGSFRRHNHRRSKPDEFEAAVLATAMDVSESLSFLDGWLAWLERRVGGGVLRSQIGNLIARVVLTLVDEVLSGARLDLWTAQANGPRLYADLQYRQGESHDLI